jgi:hypothetical protein
MDIVRLYRVLTTDQGTNGILVFGQFNCPTLELPWRDNKPNYSCIPEGTYHCTLRRSPKFGVTYHVTNVPNRSYILIHSGNYAGDSKLGYKTHTYGCLILGKYNGLLKGQKAVLVSKYTVRHFIQCMKNKDFELQIINGGYK